MIWILSLITVFKVIASDSSMNFSVRESYNILSANNGHVHATTHIANIIRNGISGFNQAEIEDLKKFGISTENGKAISSTPQNLDQTFESEHFRFYYTTEGNDAISDIDYVLQMADIFENVYKFYIDTLGFSPPAQDPASNDDLYEIFIENLPSFFFGITYTKNTSLEAPACASFIKMRNNYLGSQFNEHTEVENIQVTAVHEFFHAIQFSYNCYERFWFMEATAVWSEDELYNSVNDHYRYISPWFSNTNKPINDESSHMYGSFIFFQYIDEHLGGPSTIKLCWEKSSGNASPFQDISIKSIDEALKDLGSSFDDAYLKMRIANKIMNPNAGIYSYEEADGYISAGGIHPEIDIYYEKGIFQEEANFYLDLFETNYYKIHTSDPVEAEIIPFGEHLSMNSIVKFQGQNQWSVRSGKKINIDTEMNIEWISLLVSAIGSEQNNWDYTIEFRDGFSEDFSISLPYPNPSFGKPVSLSIEAIKGQHIVTNVYSILGHKVWSSSKTYMDSEINRLFWNGINKKGRKVSSGVYFIEISGEKKTFKNKIVYLKEEP